MALLRPQISGPALMFLLMATMSSREECHRCDVRCESCEGCCFTKDDDNFTADDPGPYGDTPSVNQPSLPSPANIRPSHSTSPPLMARPIHPSPQYARAPAPQSPAPTSSIVPSTYSPISSPSPPELTASPDALQNDAITATLGRDQSTSQISKLVEYIHHMNNMQILCIAVTSAVMLCVVYTILCALYILYRYRRYLDGSKYVYPAKPAIELVRVTRHDDLLDNRV